MSTPLQRALQAAQLQAQYAHDPSMLQYAPAAPTSGPRLVGGHDVSNPARDMAMAAEAQAARLAAAHHAYALANGLPPGGMPVKKTAAWIANDAARAQANALVAQRLAARGVAASPNISFAPKSAAWIANDRARAMQNAHGAPQVSVAPHTALHFTGPVR
jgi:hypothetical protein